MLSLSSRSPLRDPISNRATYTGFQDLKLSTQDKLAIMQSLRNPVAYRATYTGSRFYTSQLKMPNQKEPQGGRQTGKSEETTTAPHQPSSTPGDASSSTTSAVTSGVQQQQEQDEVSGPSGGDDGADREQQTKASSGVPSSEGSWTQKISQEANSPQKHNGSSGTKREEKARQQGPKDPDKNGNNALEAGTSAAVQLQSDQASSATKITAKSVTNNNRTSSTESPAGSSEQWAADNGGSAGDGGGAVVLVTEAITNGPTENDNGPPPQIGMYRNRFRPEDEENANVPKPPERKCCMCWCCCCSCSCLSVNSNARRRKKKDNNNKKQQTSLDHFFNGENDAPPSLEEIRSWGESFDRLMKCPAGRKLFRDFLKCEYSEENILFWLACEDLKKEVNPTIIEEKARVIYEDYISILSPKEVSLDSQVRDVINKNMVQPTPHTFDEAQLQIYTLMHRDSYPRFVNSSMYRKLAQLPSPSRKDSAA